MNAIDLHQKFCTLTRQTLTPRPHWMAVWKRFADQGFTVDDLEMVVRWTQRQISQGRGGFSDLSFQLRVFAKDDWSYFEERLQIARKVIRPRTQPTQAQQTTKIAVSERESVTILDPQKAAPERSPEMIEQVEKFARDLREKLNKRTR